MGLDFATAEGNHMVAAISLALEVKLSKLERGVAFGVSRAAERVRAWDYGRHEAGMGTAWLAGVAVFASVAGPKSDASAC